MSKGSGLFTFFKGDGHVIESALEPLIYCPKKNDTVTGIHTSGGVRCSCGNKVT